MSASWFACSHYTRSRLMAAESRPVYEYWFTKTNQGLSCNHVGELPYFYGNLKTMPRACQPSDYVLSDLIMDYIENFAPEGRGVPRSR